MLFAIAGTLLAIFIGMVLGSWRRDRAQAGKLRVVQDRLSARYKPEQLFVSTHDQSAVGISFERGVILLGDAQADAEYPFPAILEIEGLRDGTVLRRVQREATDAASVPAGVDSDVVRINTLELRVTVDDPDRPVWIVRFFDWPAGGVSPGNVAFQTAARDIEGWFKRLAGAMDRGREG